MPGGLHRGGLMPAAAPLVPRGVRYHVEVRDTAAEYSKEQSSNEQSVGGEVDDRVSKPRKM